MKNRYFSFSVVLAIILPVGVLAQPANNNCTGAQSLTVNAACINGTTSGATVQAGEPTPSCGAIGNQSVWYSFVATGTNMNVIFTKNGGGCTGRMSIYSGSCIPGAGTQIGCTTVSNANGAANTINLTGLTAGNTYLVRIAYSSGGPCGSDMPFCIRVECPAPCYPPHCSNGIMDGNETGVDCGGSCPPCISCTMNEECTSAIVLTNAVAVTGCNTGATVGPSFAGAPLCDMSTTATVWYSFTTGPSDVAVTVNITNTCFTQPQFAIFTACNTVLTSSCTQGASLSGYTPLSPNTTYYLAVTDAGGMECNFDVLVTTFPDNSACALSTSLVPNVTGPYVAGQTVTFTFSVLDWNKAACNWLQGIVPSWGPCWDDASFTVVSAPSGGHSAANWGWYTNVTYNLNSTQFLQGQNVGAGWFFVNNGSGNPNAAWGDQGGCNAGGGCGNCANVRTVSFSLTVKDTCDIGTDCMVRVKTFGDGEVGNWSSPGCMNDLPTYYFDNADPNDCIVPLPIELLSFRGVYSNDYVYLSWITASEIQNDYFTVERSANGQDFEPLINVKGAGNTNNSVYYNTEDKNPISGVSYYRLKQTDFDGKYSYSKIIAVSVKDNKNTFSVFPNPAENNISISFNSDLSNNAVLSVVDITGRVVTDLNLYIQKGMNKVEMDISTINKGVYFITLTNENEVLQTKFMKE